jgi:flagellar motility protein MotE (MotC chaperone)
VIKVIMLAVIGLVLGLGGGTGFALMRAKKTVAAAVDGGEQKESAKDADEKLVDDARASKAEGAEHAASDTRDSSASVAHAEPAKRDSVTAPPSAAPHTPTVAAATSAASPQTSAARPPAADTSRAGAPAPGRIAKIFAAMSAKDAARVLQQLDDADVQTVLGGLNDKQAAAILSGFPPERAAAISRAVLRGKKGVS